ncbi:hypothetical protein ACHAW6_005005 [Cyclotella cf. meneghiniana]
MLSLQHQLINPEEVSAFSVATVFERPRKEMDIRDITSTDLPALKKNDPFMYYSIPSIRKAALHFKEINAATLTVSTSDEATGRSPGRSSKSKVTRQSRMTFECHPDLQLDGLMNSLDSGHPNGVDLETPMGIHDDFFEDFFLVQARQ